MRSRIEFGPKLFLVKILKTWYLENNSRGRQKRKTLRTESIREAVRRALGLVKFCVTCGRKLAQKR